MSTSSISYADPSLVSAEIQLCPLNGWDIPEGVGEPEGSPAIPFARTVAPTSYAFTGLGAVTPFSAVTDTVQYCSKYARTGGICEDVRTNDGAKVDDQ